MILTRNHKYVTRNKKHVIVVGPHPKWPNVFRGRYADELVLPHLFWMDNGDYLHRNGKAHALDLIADITPKKS